MPEFDPGSVHSATVTFSNPKSAGFDYRASLCMGAGWTEMATASFHLNAGQSKAVQFSVTMPSAQGTYPVYFKVYCGGVLIGTFVATESVIIIAPSPARFVYLAMTPENLLVVGDPLPDLRYFIENDLTDPFFNDGWAWGADIAVKEYPSVGHCIIQNIGGEAGTFDLVLEEKVSYLDWRPCQNCPPPTLTATLQAGEARLFSIGRYDFEGIQQAVRFLAPWGYTSALAVPETSEPES